MIVLYVGEDLEIVNSLEEIVDMQFAGERKENFATEKPNWGIQLTATNVTPTGLTLVCKQSGGQPTGGLQTGSFYWLEVQIDNEWVSVEMLPREYERAWTDEAWIIPMKDSVEWDMDWESLYGELPIGEYRIGKEIIDFRSTGDYDKNVYYAIFDIK